MKMTVDLKSALLGLVIGVVAMFAIGAGTSSNDTGRYQGTVVSSNNPDDRGYALVVDTQTGKAWGTTIRLNWHSDANFFDAK